MSDIQDYRVMQVEVGDTPFKDNYGNTWVTVAFEGVSEPVKWVVKDPDSIKVGEAYTGELEVKTSKKGKDYLRFKRIRLDDAPPQQAPRQSQGQTDEYWADKQAQIRAQWAIGQAVNMLNTAHGNEYSKVDYIGFIEREAKELYAMVDRVKGSGGNEGTSETERPSLKQKWEQTKSSKIVQTADELFPDTPPEGE